MICLDVYADVRIPEGPDSTADGAGRSAQAGKSRRPRARRRRAAAPARPANVNAAPASQPAHMAPQLEDIPPVKPKPTPLPKADKRNPGR